MVFHRGSHIGTDQPTPPQSSPHRFSHADLSWVDHHPYRNTEWAFDQPHTCTSHPLEFRTLHKDLRGIHADKYALHTASCHRKAGHSSNHSRSLSQCIFSVTSPCRRNSSVQAPDDCTVDKDQHDTTDHIYADMALVVDAPCHNSVHRNAVVGLL